MEGKEKWPRSPNATDASSPPMSAACRGAIPVGYAVRAHEPDSRSMRRRSPRNCARRWRTSSEAARARHRRGQRRRISKTSFQHYVTDRLSGLEAFTPKSGVRRTRENKAFPDLLQGRAHSGTAADPLRLHRPDPLHRAEALADRYEEPQGGARGAGSGRRVYAVGVASSCVGLMENRYYKTDEEHL